MSTATLKLPRDRGERARIVEVTDRLSGRAKRAFYQKADEWAATVRNGREVIGVLNRRYDLCVLECDWPAPWFAAAFDTETDELVVCREFPRGQRPSCRTY